MAENITTVNNLPEAGDISGEDLIYLVQGTGSDRDRRLKVAALESYMNSDHVIYVNEADEDDDTNHRYLEDCFNGTTAAATSAGGDIAFEATDSRGGYVIIGTIGNGKVTEDKIATGAVTGWKIADNAVTGSHIQDGTVGSSKLAALDSVTVKNIKGGNSGISGNYVVVDNETVSGDLDVKGKAMLGSNLVTVDPDAQTAEVNGDLTVTGTVKANSVTATGKVSAGGVTTGDLTVTGKATLGGFFQQVASVGILMKDDVAQTCTVHSNAYVPPGYVLQVTIPHALTFESDEPQISATGAVITATATLGDSVTEWKISIPDFAKAAESVVIHLSQTFAVRNESATAQIASVSFALSGTIGHTGSLAVTDGGQVIFDCHAV